MPRYTSDSRQEQYEFFLTLRRQRAITAAEFQREKTKLDKAEARAIARAEAKEAAREARQRKREEERVRREKAKAKKAALMKQARGRPSKKTIQSIRKDLIADAVVRSDADFYEFWKLIKGKTVRLFFLEPDTPIGEVDAALDVPNNYKDFRKIFLETFLEEGYDADIEQTALANGHLYAVKPSNISSARLAQAFADGITHCVFTPLLRKLEERLENAVAAATKKRVSQRIAKLKGLEKEFSAGVPENKMELVARASGCMIQIFDVLGNNIMCFNKDGREGVIKMTNTRENHVDIGLVVDSDPVDLSLEEMNKLWSELKASGKFYMIDGDLKNGLPSKLRTLDGAFRLENETRDMCERFDSELGISNYRLNASKYPDVNKFIKSGRIINGWSCKLGNGVATGCADMPAAYSQFKKCSFYSGFLGHIHQFRSGSFDSAFMKEHLGYYRIRILGGLDWLMTKLGFCVDQEYVLFSPEILYLESCGMQFTSDAGAWGSRFDFEFPDYMLEKRRYCVWSGRLGMERDEKSYTISASPEWASHLACDHKVFYWERDGLLTIRKPVKGLYTTHHILGGITSYVRIQMMEAMRKFDPSQLVRVVLDGIFYTGEKPSGLEWFKDKPAKKGDGSSLSWYAYDMNDITFPQLGKITGNALLTGQGGSGKTYSVFTDKGFNNVLFVSPSHILGQDVKNKYGANYVTIHKLIGIDCLAYNVDHRVPSVILVDEITQIDASWIEKIFEMYPQSLVLLAGDIDSSGRWYQCRSGDGKEWNQIWKPHDVQIIEFTEDRRSRDDALKDLKLRVREAMRVAFGGGDIFAMKSWAHHNLKFSESIDFAEGDVVIAGTHASNKKCLDKGIVSGYYKKGGWVSDVPMDGYEKRGSFTIHSFQGKTIESGRVWIVVDDAFEYAMLYTAISRVVNFDQLRFIRRV